MPQAIDQLHGGLEAIRQQQYLYTYDNSDIDETLDRAKDDLLDGSSTLRNRAWLCRAQ